MHDAYGRADPVADPPSMAEPAIQAAVCPFLQAESGGQLVAAVDAPDSANRCVAIGDPTPQSIRQQQLVCLTASHVNCPRYLRGALVPREPVVRPAVERGPSTPVLASALFLLVAAATSVGFLLVRGGMSIPVAAATPTPNPVAVISPAPSPTGDGGAVVASPRPSPTEASLASPAPTPTPAPTPSPTPVVTPPPAATPAPPGRTGSSDRYALLVACPDAPNCWIYTVRAGDNLRSIVNWFGVQYTTVLDMNPGIVDPATIRKGDEIRMPPPTR